MTPYFFQCFVYSVYLQLLEEVDKCTEDGNNQYCKNDLNEGSTLLDVEECTTNIDHTKQVRDQAIKDTLKSNLSFTSGEY